MSVVVTDLVLHADIDIAWFLKDSAFESVMLILESYNDHVL